jgi:biopolymer transport protein TolR
MVLLIIFMVAAPFLQEEVQIQLPKADATPVPAEQGLVISVFADSSIKVDDRVVKLNDLEADLRIARPAGSTAPVFLRADANVSYGYIVRLMSMMNRAGLQDVGLVTEPLGEERRGR